MMTTVSAVNNDKTKVPRGYIFRSASLVCFTAKLRFEYIDSYSVVLFVQPIL